MSAPARPHLAPPGAWRTRANGLTALRLLAAPLLGLALWHGAHGAALALFSAAVASDLLDGRVARRFGESSPLGGFLDHATDAIFASAGLAVLAAAGEVPRLLPGLVPLAFVQYALDSRAPCGRRLRASALGRWNGIGYIALLGVPVVRDALALGWPSAAGVWSLGALLCASTLVSMAERLVRSLRGRAPGPEAGGGVAS